MFLIKVTAEQKNQLMEAMDIVVKQQGINCLNIALPLLTAIQTAEEVDDVPELKVVADNTKE